ncbi:LacI family DNA-binding transcriptional regulator [Nonomuraea sp. B12E4]|uniref:LacI family DNA-binding transcriptional regulator n=1 Tax=Nonomuraea sp. B12E4 TaxID=3153564 RepID=UPI00325F7472
MAVTMADVARRAGTSIAVVSYVVNDGPRPVAARTRERVIAAAAELGYRHNRVAAALRSGSSGLVGVVLPDTVNPYFAALGRRLEEALTASGKLMVVANSGYDGRRQATAIEALLGAQVDGLIIVSASGADDPAGPATEEGASVVYVHHRPPGSATTLVAADNEAGVAAAVAHLREHGHARIDFLAGPTDEGPVGDRVAAWRATGVPGELLRSAFGRAAAARLVAGLGTVPRALVVATDEQAVGVLAACGAAGVDVPGRLALISCDGSPETAFTVPPLTAVEQPLAEMARQSVRHLLGEPVPGGTPAATLTVRRSCGCPHPGFPTP